jgi:hypothetical protein
MGRVKMIIEANCTTGEIIERELSAEELAQQEADNATSVMSKNAEAEFIAAQTAQKTALLAKLGITDDEAKLLLS